MSISNNEIIVLAFIFYGENIFIPFEDLFKYLTSISAKLLARGDYYLSSYSFGDLKELVKDNPDIFVQDGFNFKCCSLDKARDLYLKDTSKDFLSLVKKFEGTMKN